MRNPFTLGAVGAVLMLLAGCGSSGTTTSASSPASTAANAAGGGYSHSSATTTAATATSTAPSAPASAAIVVTSKPSKNGTVLAAGPKRLTVYMFDGDHGSASACSGGCAAVWPPVTTSTAAHAASGAMAADLGTITRADGTKQVTYNGHPLYFFARDKDDGDSYGQGVKSFGAGWYVIAPSGAKVDSS